MLCELVSVQVLVMPAEVPEPRVAGPQSPGGDRTLKQSVLEYCLVLGAGGEDLRPVVDSVAPFPTAGAGLRVPEWCGARLVRGTGARRGEHWKGRGEVLDGGDGARRPARWQAAAVGAEAGPGSPRAGAVRGGPGGRARGAAAAGGAAARALAAVVAGAGGGQQRGSACAPRG